MSKNLRLLLLATCVATVARADFNPIPLTPGSFNYDVVVENTSRLPGGRYATAMMDDSGTNINNGGNGWYEVGYNPADLTAGIPAAGSTFTHQSFSDHQYTMPASYTAPNALYIGNTVSNGTFTLTTPALYGNLSVLGSGGNGPIVLNYTIRHADDTTETGSVSIGDWFNVGNPAWTAKGRIDLISLTLQSNGDNPRLLGNDITVANTTSPVTSIEFTYVSGGRCGLLALSGAPVGGGAWSPIAVTGYTYDMVVEASAPQAGAFRSATTASMDGGTNNTGNTWFERGWDPLNPNAGIPNAGSTMTSQAASDHHYMMPASYSANNALMVDSNAPIGNLTIASPQAFSALSFLSATANGSVSTECVMQHADGTSETNVFVSRDWFNNSPVAWLANGRVNLDSCRLDNLNNNNPRLYEAQFGLVNLASPVTNVVLKWIGGSTSSRVVVLAVSGTAGAVAPIISVHPQSVTGYDGTNFSVFGNAIGTAPITYRWLKLMGSSYVALTNSVIFDGVTTTNLSITNATISEAGDYFLAADNSVGSATSLVARVTVLTTLTDVTSPSDVITGFGGTAPDGESVAHIIDNDTAKYLNFGAGTSPWAGPVGAIITPAAGSSKVTGIRLYAANDTTERDPASYSVEGSIDGGATYTLISSNALSLPDARNNGNGALSPLTQSIQEVLFSNATMYDTYRVTFYTVKNAAGANSMQIGEIELLGVLAPKGPVLKIVRQDDDIIITSSQPAQLEGTDELKGEATIWMNYGEVSEEMPQFFSNEGNQFFRTVPLPTPN